jgi:hypothetical protein
MINRNLLIALLIGLILFYWWMNKNLQTFKSFVPPNEPIGY